MINSSIGPVGAFRLNIWGKIYVLEDTVSDCEQINGDMLAINYILVIYMFIIIRKIIYNFIGTCSTLIFILLCQYLADYS